MVPAVVEVLVVLWPAVAHRGEVLEPDQRAVAVGGPLRSAVSLSRGRSEAGGSQVHGGWLLVAALGAAVLGSI